MSTNLEQASRDTTLTSGTENVWTLLESGDNANVYSNVYSEPSRLFIHYPNFPFSHVMATVYTQTSHTMAMENNTTVLLINEIIRRDSALVNTHYISRTTTD